jgi:hypothetical protein
MNSKFTPVLAFAIALLFSFNTSYSQDQEVSVKTADSIKIKRFNLGLKVGIPNLIGGSAEILLPHKPFLFRIRSQLLSQQKRKWFFSRFRTRAI